MEDGDDIDLEQFWEGLLDACRPNVDSCRSTLTALRQMGAPTRDYDDLKRWLGIFQEVQQMSDEEVRRKVAEIKGTEEDDLPMFFALGLEKPKPVSKWSLAELRGFLVNVRFVDEMSEEDIRRRVKILTDRARKRISAKTN